MPAQTELQQSLLSAKKSALAKYRDLVVGRGGFFALLKFELITCLFGSMPGALGLLMRKIFFKKLLGKCGRGVVFGRGVVLRHPHKISIGSNVVIDDTLSSTRKAARRAASQSATTRSSAAARASSARAAASKSARTRTSARAASSSPNRR